MDSPAIYRATSAYFCFRQNYANIFIPCPCRERISGKVPFPLPCLEKAGDGQMEIKCFDINEHLQRRTQCGWGIAAGFKNLVIKLHFCRRQIDEGSLDSDRMAIAKRFFEVTLHGNDRD